MDATLADSYRFCGALSRREAKNFYYGFLLLPPAPAVDVCPVCLHAADG